MDIRKLQRAIVDGLEDVKAQDIVVFNTEHLSPLFERVIIASGTSNRQTKALAASVRDAVRRMGQPVLGIEGEDNGEWIIVDCGAAVAHIMQPTLRDYYRLEEIWGEKPVRLKRHATPSGLVKASVEPMAEDAPAPTAKAAGKATGKKVAKKVGKAVAKTVAEPAAKRAAKSAAKPRKKSVVQSEKPVQAKPAGPRAPRPKAAVAGKVPAKGAAKVAAKVGVKAGAKRAAGTSTPSAAKTARRPASKRAS